MYDQPQAKIDARKKALADQELKLALRKMLQVELDAMQYYQQATRFMQDQGAIDHFNQLAQEELVHARSFYNIYPDNDLPEFAEMINNLPEQAPSLKGVDQLLMARLTEQHALQLAIKLEKALAESLEKMLNQMQSPAARAVIEMNIESTRGHLELIEQDYQRLFR